MSATVLITGVSGKIGTAIAEKFASLGSQIVGVDIIPSLWTDWQSIDLSSENTSEILASKFDFEGLSCVVHAAAVQPIGSLQGHSRDVWEQTMWSNFLALDHLVKTFYPFLSKNSGSAVLISSVHARLSRRGLSLYSVSKAAAEGWVKSAALDYAPTIRINSVMPGAIESGKLYEGRNRENPVAHDVAIEELRRRTPLGTIGSPEDIARAVSFLAGSEASFITGQTLVVDGGATLLLGTESGQ